MPEYRERVRQNKAMQSILRGETPEKRIFVSQEDLEFKKKLQKEKEIEQKRIEEKLEATKEARMPWFCPECKKVLKRQLDEKMWYLYQHCFDCQIKIENKMRIDGTYNEWEQEKVKQNKLSRVREEIQKLKEFKKQKIPTFYNQVAADGYTLNKENWQGNFKQLKKQADEALKHLQKVEDSLT
jgi:isopropylmalate/homocitrate/citramalate synthase